MDKPHRLAQVPYVFPAEGSDVVPGPHGNSKGDTPFYPTLPSTIAKIKSESSLGPKEVVENVSDRMGGVMHASYSGALPQEEQQQGS